MNKESLKNEDRHHTIFGRRAWEDIKLDLSDGSFSEVGLALREQESLIVPLDRSQHEKLHELVHPMPALGALAVQSVLVDYTDHIKDPSIHPVKAIDQLQKSLDIIPARLTDKDEDLMIELCLQSLDDQRRMIREVLDNRRYFYEKSKRKNISMKQERRNGRRAGYAIHR